MSTVTTSLASEHRAPAARPTPRDETRELRRSALGPAIEAWYRLPRQRRWAIAAARRLEGGHFRSATLRRILAARHGVRVGAYSYGECCVPGSFPAGTVVGRYVSCAAEVRVLEGNHPTDRLSMHPYFYNPALGIVREEGIEPARLEIGHDAWIGARAIVTPQVRRIGVGAVVGAGAIVTRDVPDFAVVAGNPARILRMRFPDELCATILASRWWDRPIEEVGEHLAAMLAPVEPTHPLLGGGESR